MISLWLYDGVSTLIKGGRRARVDERIKSRIIHFYTEDGKGDFAKISENL